MDFVTDRLRRLGMEPRRYGQPDRPALVAQFGKGGVMLSGHLDTVPHGTGWSKEQAETVDGVMYGRGSADMKGGCTAMLLAAERLVEANVPFSLCFTTDEETTMHGAEAAATDHAFRTAPAVVVTEPSDMTIITKEKGLLQFSVKTSGRAAHASMPHLGENAIAKMVVLLSRLDDLQKVPADPLNSMTLCADTIRGGTRINVIPAECEAEIDVRYPPNMTADSVLRLVRERVGDVGFDIRIQHQLDPVETDRSSAAVQTMKDIIGPSAVLAEVPYATEMVKFKPANSNLLVCGPGLATMAHVIDERIELAQIERAIEVYVEYCSRMSSM